MKTGEYIKAIITKQCEIVGADPETINPKEQGWYMKYSWTKEQEKEFKDWFIKYLKNNKEFQRNIIRWPSFKNIVKAVDEWCSNYGWRYGDEKI